MQLLLHNAGHAAVLWLTGALHFKNLQLLQQPASIIGSVFLVGGREIYGDIFEPPGSGA